MVSLLGQFRRLGTVPNGGPKPLKYKMDFVTQDWLAKDPQAP